MEALCATTHLVLTEIIVILTLLVSQIVTVMQRCRIVAVLLFDDTTQHTYLLESATLW